ncbi:exported hypothetical protein [Vibrio chagasii]|nr:exported hypothetical protein [Vibrio chagasii]
MKKILILSLLISMPISASTNSTHAQKYGTCLGLAAAALEYSSGLGDYITWKMKASSVKSKADAAGLTKYDLEHPKKVAFQAVETNDEHYRFAAASTRFHNANCDD